MKKNIQSVNFEQYASENDKNILETKRTGSVSDSQRKHYYLKKELIPKTKDTTVLILSEVLKNIYKCPVNLFEQEPGYKFISNIDGKSHNIILSKKWNNDKLQGIEVFISSKNTLQWTNYEIKKHWLFKKGSVFSFHEKTFLNDASEKFSYDGMFRSTTMKSNFKKKFKYITSNLLQKK